MENINDNEIASIWLIDSIVPTPTRAGTSWGALAGFELDDILEAFFKGGLWVVVPGIGLRLSWACSAEWGPIKKN